ncbi:hypothetical protein CEXT_66701 [Caerostris extrusa]|uniref:Uncharacterized protein n=1 Tax=Caerostris extrusa TaxID=172846 RepID=A0AAV4PHI4_CAEEX|nr:hypothetical protein CEXT_66701 [Caerostris extrusa]
MQHRYQLATVQELLLEDTTEKRRKGKQQKQSLPRSPSVIDKRRNSTLRGNGRGGVCFVLWGKFWSSCLLPSDLIRLRWTSLPIRSEERTVAL